MNLDRQQSSRSSNFSLYSKSIRQNNKSDDGKSSHLSMGSGMEEDDNESVEHTTKDPVMASLNEFFDEIEDKIK